MSSPVAKDPDAVARGGEAGTTTTALVTGASSGIGEVTAEQLARAGYKVYGTSRRGARGQIGKRTFEMLALDVTSDESVAAAVNEVLTPLEILGRVLDKHVAPGSRVLAIGGPELEAAVVDGGHVLVSQDRYREAQAVVVGNDFDFSFARLTAASRAVAGGAAFLTPNLDARLPVEGDDFLPGCGAIVEAVAAAAASRPLVVGKPEPPLFELALSRMGLTADDAAMVGDSVDSDIRGARRVGLTAVLFAPKGGLDGVAHYMVKSMLQLRRLLETYAP